MPKVIAIDGPAASGKTSTGYEFSKNIGFNFLDAGSIYRSGCIIIASMDLPINDDEGNARIYQGLNLHFENMPSGQQVFLSGINITNELNAPYINRIVSTVGSKPLVRKVVKDIQIAIETVHNF